MPCTPIAESASRTSSSLNGLMMAVTIFMFASPPVSERLRVRNEAHEAIPAPVLALDRVEVALRVGTLVVRAQVEAVAEVVGRARLPHRVREVAVVEPSVDLRALVALVAEHAVQRQRGEHRQWVI